MIILSSLLIKTISVISTTQKTNLQSKFTNNQKMLTDMVSTYKNSIQSNVNSCNLNKGCSSDSFIVLSPSSLTSDSKLASQNSNLDDISTIRSNQGIATTTAQTNDICRVKNILLTKLKTNYNDPTVGMQYIIHNSTGATAIYPSTSLPSGCPFDYRTSNIYKTSYTQGKNIILLIDVSNSDSYAAARLVIQKSVAIQFLNKLSNNDFVAIVTYWELSSFYANILLPANTNNIALLITYVNGLTLKSGKIYMTAAIDASINILKNSKNTNSYSPCSPDIWVLLSGGQNQVSIYQPQQKVNILQNTVNFPLIFSYVISPGNPNPVYLIPGLLSCLTNGFIYILTDSNKKHQIYQSFFNYLTASFPMTSPRWGRTFTNSYGTQVVSVSLPVIYKNQLFAVAGMQVPLTSINQGGSIPTQDIDNVIANPTCESFTFNQQYQISLQGGISCSVLQSRSTGLVLPLAYHKGTVGGIFGAFFFIQIIIVGGWIFYKACNQYDYRLQQIYSYLAFFTVISIFLCIWFCINLFVGLYDDFVVIYYYQPVIGTVQSKVNNGFRCCDITSCSCFQASSQPNCINNLASLTQGNCANGYYCCSTYCRSYRCGKSTCRSCTCSRSVSNALCRSSCGTCYVPTITFSYNSLDKKPYIGKQSGNCTRDDTVCLQIFLDSVPDIGGSTKIFYNPIDPSQIKRSLNLNIAAVVFFALCLLGYVIVYGLMIRQFILLRRAMQDVLLQPNNNQQSGIINNVHQQNNNFGKQINYNSNNYFNPNPEINPQPNGYVQPGMQPGYQPMQPGYVQPMQPGYVQPGMQPGYGQNGYQGFQAPNPGSYPAPPPGYPVYNQPQIMVNVK